jgi:hypothetical protein
MIIDKDNIIYYETESLLGQNTYLNKVKMHKPTGVIFQCSILKETQEFAFFLVGALNSESKLEDRKSFDGKTSESFFEAVAYFEKLIESRIPDTKTPPPSVGKFTFVKGKDGIINMPGTDEVIVDREDLEKVFTPPKNKPYGRLNMLEVEKEKYEIVKSKFALNYNEQATNEYAEQNNLNTNECAVYDMTPYSNGTEESEGQPDPNQVNDENISLNDIEEESEDDLKGSDTNKDKEPSEDEGEQGEKGEKGDEQSEGEEGEQGEEAEKGEKGDEQSEGEEGEEGEESEDEGKGEPNEGEPNEGEGEGEEIDRTINKEIKPKDIQLNTDTLIGKLNELFKFDISNLRSASRVKATLNGYTEEQLKDFFYDKLNIPKTVTKQQFLNTVEEQIKPYF